MKYQKSSNRKKKFVILIIFYYVIVKERMAFYTSIYLIGPLPSMLYIAVSCYQYHDCHTIVSGIIMK